MYYHEFVLMLNYKSLFLLSLAIWNIRKRINTRIVLKLILTIKLLIFKSSINFINQKPELIQIRSDIGQKVLRYIQTRNTPNQYLKVEKLIIWLEIS